MHRRPSQSHSPISTTICTMLSLKSARGSDDSFSTATPTPSSSSAIFFLPGFFLCCCSFLPAAGEGARAGGDALVALGSGSCSLVVAPPP
uniref:Uncharacterized protein n=1 Tax=Arundo donax TaxID=35708 RepID=A0A0A9FUI0_ARUDO